MHGTTYGDLLDNVGDAKPLVFVVRKDQYVFGVYISAGIQEPDDPTDWNKYGSDVWYFSLAGHFPQPTKIEIHVPDFVRGMLVAGRKGNVGGSNLEIGGFLSLGSSGKLDGPPAADIRSISQFLMDVPEGYTGVTGFLPAELYVGERHILPLLGGSYLFMADEIEVLRAVQ